MKGEQLGFGFNLRFGLSHSYFAERAIEPAPLFARIEAQPEPDAEADAPAAQVDDERGGA